MMPESKNLTPQEKAFFSSLHTAVVQEAAPNEKGQWQFTGPYGTDAHNNLAERQQQSAGEQSGYSIRNNLMGIFSEAVVDAILGHSVETRIAQYLKGLGGDGGLQDGKIHGVSYDVKATVSTSQHFTLKGGIGDKEKKILFIFSKLTIDKELQQATVLFYGYAWRPDVLPYAPKAQFWYTD
jgi:hypothetical protein